MWEEQRKDSNGIAIHMGVIRAGIKMYAKYVCNIYTHVESATVLTSVDFVTPHQPLIPFLHFTSTHTHTYTDVARSVEGNRRTSKDEGRLSVLRPIL